jgi:hypothetical protein
MTSIESLFNKLWEEPKDKLTWYSIFEQAKEMQKKEMIDFAKNCLNKAKDTDILTAFIKTQQYYEETFGSKISGDTLKDYHIVDTNEMVYSQTEISDEEIDNAVVKEYENVGDEKLFPNHTDKDIWMNGFYEGAKWYRQQLKTKTK